MNVNPQVNQLLVRRGRILLLLGSLHGGGAERVAVHLLNQLPTQRFDVRMGLLRASGPYLDQIDRNRVLIAPNGEKHFNYDGPNSAQFTLRKVLGGATRAPMAIRKMIQQARPDVVMSFLKGINLLAWPGIAFSSPRPKWIAREGNNVPLVIEQESPNAATAKISLSATKAAYRSADIVLANSSDMAEYLINDFGLAPANVRMINNPIAVDDIRSRLDDPLPGVPKRPFLLNAGRLEPQKAHDILIRAYAASPLCRTHALVILGKGSLLGDLRALAARLGVGEHVHFMGFVKNPYAWMARTDLFILPSLWEGFPTVAAEAMASGAPLLVSDCRFGMHDVVKQGITGEIVPTGDVDALAAAMTHLIAHPEHRASLVAAGAQWVRRFDLPAMIDSYADVFEELAFA